MMRSNEFRYGHHTVSRLSAHIVWATKYRYKVLTGEIQHRCRDLLIQVCDSEDVKILQGVVSNDHLHMHLEYSPSKSISDMVKRLKSRSSRKLQQEFPDKYWGKHFWAIGYGVWSSGNVTDKMIEEYLKHHRDKSNFDSGTMILK